MYIKRNLESTISRYLDSPEIIAILGARQCGKTTLVKHFLKYLPNAIFVSFEDRNILNMFEKDTAEFISLYVKNNKFLFIDEFQYAKNGGKILKYIFDTQKIKIIITGSSAVDLTIRAVKYLVGRVLIFNLYPFDLKEFLLAKDKEVFKLYKKFKIDINNLKDKIQDFKPAIHQKFWKYYEEYLIYGGYPRVVLEKNYDSKKEIIRNIYNTYFLREVKDILGLIDDYKLSSLIKGLALQIGNLIEYRELSNLSGYSHVSLKKYLNFFEKTYICRLVKPFFKNKRTEIVKNPKVYFLDTGLRNFIVNDFRDIDKRDDQGSLLENGLASQFMKQDLIFNFWRNKKKNELDFVIDIGDGKIIAIESKSYLKSKKNLSVEVFKRKYPEIDIYFSYKDIANLLKGEEKIYPVYFY
ncbi:ATP-binding protein [bacterium]|nr:ATP-binding protein [bacterium]